MKWPRGYTIVEALIVLVVSAAMFIIVTVVFAGRQQQVVFTRAVRDFDSKMQDNINDVATSYFDTSNNVTCEVTGGGSGILDVDQAPSTEDRGTSDRCIVLGRVIQFELDDADTRSGPGSFVAYTMLGRRFSGNSLNPVRTISEATPQPAVERGNIDTYPTAEFLEGGLRITKVHSNDLDNAEKQTGAIALVSSFSYVAGSGQEQSNNNAIQFLSVEGIELNENRSDVVTALQNFGSAGVKGSVIGNGGEKITICLSDGEINGRKAALVLHPVDGSTELQFDTYDEAICG